MPTYLLKGTISIRVDSASSPKESFDVVPAEGFMTPDLAGPKQAVAFLNPAASAGTPCPAILIPMTDGKVVACHLDPSVAHLLDGLFVVAAQKQLIELHLDGSSPFKIVGLAFPSR